MNGKGCPPVGVAAGTYTHGEREGYRRYRLVYWCAGMSLEGIALAAIRGAL